MSLSPQKPSKAQKRQFILDMYPGIEFSEFEMAQAIRDHSALIGAYFELGCDVEEEDTEDRGSVDS